MDKRTALVAIVVCFVLVVAAAFGIGRCTAPTPPAPIVVEDPDAGAADEAFASGLDASVQTERARLEALEREHADEVAALRDAERAEYEARRAQGRDSLARWFKERTRALLQDGGR
jgi:hypothetical protein